MDLLPYIIIVVVVVEETVFSNNSAAATPWMTFIQTVEPDVTDRHTIVLCRVGARVPEPCTHARQNIQRKGHVTYNEICTQIERADPAPSAGGMNKPEE